MESFLSKLPNLQIRDKIRVDDTVDQLHHFVTVYLFASFALMIGLKEYAGTPLDCWVTLANFKHFQDHVNSYCWTHRLYRYPDKHNLSKVSQHGYHLISFFYVCVKCSPFSFLCLYRKKQFKSTMEKVIGMLKSLNIKATIRDDDTVDQLHHVFTVFMLAAFGIVIGLKEYTEGPLNCWLNYTMKHFQDHANYYCWMNKLYRYPNPDNLSQVPYELDSDGGPQNTTLLHNSETVGQINFYRWITVIFLVQALLFKLPNLVWNICNEYSGTQIEKMVTMIADSSFDSKEKKATTFSSVAEYLETWLKINRKPFWFMKNRVTQQSKKILRYWMICLGANTRNYLSTMYLVIKAAFLLNVVLQFIMLTAFLDFNYWHYGAKALEIYHKTRSTQDRTHFPRVALCHFQVRGSGHWIQCLLTINMLLEKLLIVEWFWLMVLLCITIYSLFNWLARILRTGQSVKFIVKYLSVFNDDGTLPQDGKRTVLTFVRDYLGNDGVFMLRILALNTNDVVMSELICSVWKRYIDYNNTSSGKEDPEKAPEPSCDITMDDVELKPLTSNDKLNDELHIQ